MFIGLLIGLDGIILSAFILGFPANEIVLPIILMGYMSLGVITDINDLDILVDISIKRTLFRTILTTFVGTLKIMIFEKSNVSSKVLSINLTTYSQKLSDFLTGACNTITCCLLSAI